MSTQIIAGILLALGLVFVVWNWRRDEQRRAKLSPGARALEDEDRDVQTREW